MSKQPAVFISHASQDADLARALKNELDQALAHNVEVFASSLPNAITSGEDWLTLIKRRMEEARSFVVLITPRSLTSHWIWFELGYFWHSMDVVSQSERAMPEKRIYPLYVNNVSIPNPLSHLQAKWLHDKDQMTVFFRNIYYQFADILLRSDTSSLKTYVPAHPAAKVVKFVDTHYG